jgi:type II secretory pathway component PulK
MFDGANRVDTFDKLQMPLPEIPIKIGWPFVTIYSDPDSPISRVNINTAPRQVITAMVSDTRTVERILESRKLKPFTGPGDREMAAIDTAISRYLTYDGAVYRIISVAQVKDTIKTVEAVVAPNRKSAEFPYAMVLSWQEY